MRFLLILMCACAVPTPSNGNLYQCEGFITCSDGAYRVSASGCASSDEEAEQEASESLEELAHSVDCELNKLYVSCGRTEDDCYYLED